MHPSLGDILPCVVFGKYVYLTVFRFLSSLIVQQATWKSTGHLAMANVKMYSELR